MNMKMIEYSVQVIHEEYYHEVTELFQDKQVACQQLL